MVHACGLGGQTLSQDTLGWLRRAPPNPRAAAWTAHSFLAASGTAEAEPRPRPPDLTTKLCAGRRQILRRDTLCALHKQLSEEGNGFLHRCALGPRNPLCGRSLVQQ